MHYLDESHIFLFLVQVALLLGLARGLGVLFQRIGQPAITAEIIVGILLGPTILGRVWPAAQSAIFPAEAVQRNMLDTVAWLGILFFLLHTGLDTDFAAAWRQRRDAAVIALSDLVLPMVIAFVPCMLLPDRYLPDPGQRLMFGLFIAMIMTISALPVTARVLQELQVYRSDAGLLIMGALTINDVAGWLVFAVILGFATGGGMGLGQVAFILVATLVFATVSLTVGRYLTQRAIASFHRRGLPEPGTSLTFICLLGLLGGAITLKIGIHALFGFFIAGVMAGEARALSENTKQVIAQMVRAVLVPLFFASIGLKLDFLKGLDLVLVLGILVIGVAGRFVGAWVGVSLTEHSRANRHLIAAAHVPGGEMQIVIGLLALEYKVIGEPIFVAIVLGALLTSIGAGPWMKAALSRARRLDILQFFSRECVRSSLAAQARDEAIGELCAVAAQRLGRGDGAEDLTAAAIEREQMMGTALGDGIAVPHARISGLARGTVVAGRSHAGIDWDAPDGQHVHLVFLVLTPRGEDDVQLRIIRAISLALQDADAKAALERSTTDPAMWDILRRSLASGAAA